MTYSGYAGYLELLKDRYRHYFDLYENYQTNAKTFDLLASCNIQGEKYMLSKELKIYTVEQNEHCLLDVFNKQVNENDVSDFFSNIKQTITDLVNPHPDHMKTILTGVIIAKNGATPSSKEFVKQYRYQKPFMLFLKGWCEVRLVLVDLDTQEVISHPKDKEVNQLYTPQVGDAS